MKLVFIPFIEVGDVAHFYDASEMWAVDMDFEFALVFFGEVPNVVERPLVLFRRGGKVRHFFCSPAGDKMVEPDKVRVVLLRQLADMVKMLIVYGGHGAG